MEQGNRGEGHRASSDPAAGVGAGGLHLRTSTTASRTFGQWPVTYNPMQAHFGAVIHNVDVEFYDTYYNEGYVNDRIRNRSKIWHD